MKRIMVLMLMLCLLAGVAAMAEAVGNAPLTPAAGEALVVDLDGDGTDETLTWAMEPGEYDEAMTLTVTGADGAPIEYETDILWGEAVYVVDLDGDGAQEVLMSGDEMSDDYVTYCLHYAGGALHEVLFPDCGRGENNRGYYRTGYGRITGIGDNRLTLAGSQDVLGTWFASRTVALTPWDRFEFFDAGLWERELGDTSDPDLWGYGALTLKVSLAFLDLQDGSTGTLEPGSQLLVYASDKREFARFIARDGTNGALSISPDYERGWGWLVDGIPEEDCFEQVFYAD